MKVTPLAIPDVLLIEPKVFGDDRGFFLESFHAKRYADVGVVGPFVQDNLSRSVKGTLRGLHFQEPNAQGKLVQCLAGAVWDVAVDIRKGSPTFGRWVAAELTGENKHQLWVPAGFAHGFCVVSDSADFFYKCTALYSPESERSVAWNDPDLAIPWPVKEPLLSPKDQRAPRLKDAPVLPVF
ncbi:dTDP-4-dehydrorhamnose 3,5-epimerase [Corallococcus sp. CA054B]|uniref:dTDP-4-dehydrorhamnose 3,5-epimerase n=1 Tax=unclassified Corallococcus TaxID=2685029 RepID=UPI000EA23C88|nr:MULTISPECIES: dTDP-4-dehydrorhamnose 3,5-epimerase [unclassified Corallococcus]RKG67427.1 dTDP-4-dehydrorhamnose 3,5-epimerase [Corallococcus sp. CA054B]RKH89837.1 dTDP-4-dehydrorhamnose 3,5-epimerase [Corallococcus sp. AB045]